MSPDTRSEPERCWSLSAAVDALGVAARQAGRPGLVWIAGSLYPSWTTFEIGTQVGRRLDGNEVVQVGLFALVVWIVSWRLMAGLARVAHPQDWARWNEAHGRPPRLREVWDAGRGSTRGALGLWLLISLMLLIVLAILLSPVGLSALGRPRDLEPIGLLLIGPILIFLVTYASVLSVLHQLALHSLVRNRRGVGSALTHAWRIARHDPLRTFQAMLPDLVLAITTSAAGWLVFGLFGGGTLAAVLIWAVNGFAGVTRAAYWAQAYRALGGLAPEDGVPGLEPLAAAHGEHPGPGVGADPA